MSAPEMENANTSPVRLDLAYWLRLLHGVGPQLMTLQELPGQLLFLELKQEKRHVPGSALSISFAVMALLLAGFAVLYLHWNNASFTFFIWLLPVVFILLAVSCFFCSDA